MGKAYVFAIGGTGARLLRSLSMTMASGMPGITETTEICPIIIDYDLHNGDKDRASACLKQYEAVRKYLAKGITKGYQGYFAGKVTELPYLDPNSDYSWIFDVEDENQTFSKYIGYNKLQAKSARTAELVKTLYDTSTDPEYTELEINMRVGFQGNPNIGSVVFDRLKDQSVFTTFIKHFDPDNDRIIIIGSVFGGTGSSGVPKLVEALRGDSMPASVKRAKIATILVLPYFQVNNAGGGADSIKSIIFNSKTKAALNYYEKSNLNDNINVLYYIGDKTPMTVEPHIGGKTQQNNAHPVELIGAMAIAHFLGMPLAKVPSSVKYKFGIPAQISNGISLEDFAGKGAVVNPFVQTVIARLINFTLSMKYFADSIVENKDKSLTKSVNFYGELKMQDIADKTKNSTPDAQGNVNYLQDFCATLYKFYQLFAEWITELQADSHNTHRLKFFNLGGDIKDVIQGVPLEKKKESFMDKAAHLKYTDFHASMNEAMTSSKEAYDKSKGIDKKNEMLPFFLEEFLYYTGKDIRKTKNLEKQFDKLVTGDEPLDHPTV